MNKDTKCGIIHIMEYDSAIKMNDMLIHAKTWIKLENSMLGERYHSEKATDYMPPFVRMSEIGKSLETKKINGC